MSERSFRLLQGVYILLALYFELDVLIFAYLVVLAFEGLTNWRIPILVNRLRHAQPVAAHVGAWQNVTETQVAATPGVKFDFEAERLMRLVVFVLMIFTVLIFPEAGWFFPWFIGAMLFLAGLTNICPMVLMLRYLGFR